MGRQPRRHVPVCGRAFTAVALAAGLAASASNFVSLQAPRRAPATLRRAEDMSIGHCLQPDGTWKLDPEKGMKIEGPEENALAVDCWKAFQGQYTSAADRGMYMDTPVAEEDIKYRFRRLRETFGISTSEALDIMKIDALPLVIDSDYVKKTFDAMVEGASREKALEIIKRHPGILAAGPDVKSNMLQADVASVFIGGARSVSKMFR
eukprot:TRINITY_DN58892_c0_g1_i1.p1 TRINITY_DN58892_c0_g1~~TRINITY_DN58892_c0_g1_i1.p1  ORF type:complete len:230 (-),score=55.86 TRINITY_DN58892_c0_g1_i1:95-715(-)